MVSQHPWRRYVALGDSFTEGVGDEEPQSPGGLRGWADRVAEVLNQDSDEFAYANLAVRGKLIRQIIADQLDDAIAMHPDLITFCAGGNDILRPGSDPDEVAQLFEDAVARLTRETDATIVVFTGIDTGNAAVFRLIRGKVAIYDMNVYRVAHRYDCIVVDQWAFDYLKDPRMWADDRLHMNSLGHHNLAISVLKALNVENELTPEIPEPLPERPWRQARADDIVWAREFLWPWVLRRIRHQSSGDERKPKRPEPTHLD